MIIRLYSLCVMFLDLSVFLIYSLLSIIISSIHTIRPPPQKSLNNELILVIGSSRGVGKELAILLGKLGADIICVDVNSLDNESTVMEIRKNGGQAYAYNCDVTVQEQVKKTINNIQRDIGTITMLFHCCGVPSPNSLLTTPTSINKTIDLSIVSHFWLLEEVLPAMKKINHGHIVLLSSVAGLSGIKHQMPLTVSQFAVQGIFESILDDLRIGKYTDTIFITMCHVYPFIVSENLMKDIRLRIPSYFGTIKATEAAEQIILAVRRNYMEVSIPWYLIHIGHLMKLLPRKVILMLRDLLDTGVDFG